jgi:hypothetical protein
MDDQAGGRSVIDHEGALKGADHANDNNTYGQNDNSHPSNDSTALYVAQHESISEISKLREELRLMQEKLSQVDERTRLDSRAGMHDNFTTKTVNEKKARRGVPLRGIYNAPPRPVSIGRRETSEESGEESSEESNEENEATQWSLKPALNKVEWNIFESCRRTRKNESFVLDVLVGEPVLSDFHPTTYGHPKKTSFEGGRQGETYTETAVPGQEPLPERIRIHSIGLLKALDSIHGVGINSTNRLVMVRPFKFLTFYQTQIRQWLDKEQKELAADAGDCKRTTQTLLALCSSEATHSYLQTSETVSRQPDPTLLENELSIPGDVEPRSDQPPTCDRVKDNKPDRSRQERVMHVRCLLELIDSSISSKQNHLEKKAKKVSFIDLWHLFTVGTEIIENGDKHMQCYKVFKVISPKHKVAKRKKDFRLFRSKERPETSLFIHCVYVDFNGWLLGPVSKMFSITRYQGMRDIKSLPVYPLRFEDNSEEIRRRLIDRGNKFFKAVQLGHMHYSGLTLGSKDEVDGQVVIDFTEALNRPKVDKSEWVPEIQLRVGKEQEKPRRRDREYMYDSDSDDEKDYCQAGCCAGEDVLDDSFIDARQSEQYLADLLTGSDEDEGPAPLAVIAQVMQKAKEILVTEDDLVLMTYRVFGFVLRSRSWGKFLGHFISSNLPPEVRLSYFL